MFPTSSTYLYTQPLTASQFVASIFVAAFNVARLKRQGNTLPSVINILFFGVGGFFLTLLSLDESIDRFTRPPYYCTRDLKGGPDDADDGLQYYEGTYQECLEWAPTYDVVTWFYLFFLSVTR